jgi:hypothetical protein
MLELKLQSMVLVAAFGSSSQRIKKQVYIPFLIGDDCFEYVFLISGQLTEMLTGADFLQDYTLLVNFKTNCLMYEIEGNMKEHKFTYKVEAELESQESIGHGLPETVDHNVTQAINDESSWTVRKYVAFVNRNRELYVDMMQEEINPLDISVKKNGKENTPRMSKLL